jgi:hypothetical protein
VWSANGRVALPQLKILDVLCDGVIFVLLDSVNRVGFPMSSIDVNIVSVSTELKTRLVTLAYTIFTGELFSVDTNLRELIDLPGPVQV